MGETTVTDVFIDQTFGGLLAHVIVAMKPIYPAHSKKVGRLVAAMSPLKRVTVVDEDIDIRDHTHVEWAMNSRYNPSRDTVLIDTFARFATSSMDTRITLVHAELPAGRPR